MKNFWKIFKSPKQKKNQKKISKFDEKNFREKTQFQRTQIRKKKLNFDIKIQGKITNSKKVESEKKFKNQINMNS